MYQFMINNKDVITLLISICAFIISLISFLRTKVTYTCIFKPKLRKVNEIKLIDENANAHRLYKDIQIGYVDFINLSPYDLGYFELIAYDSKTNDQYEILFKSNIPSRFQSFDFIEEIIPTRRWIHYDLPDKNSGILKAKSNTRLYFLIQVSEVPKSITVRFKITHYKPFHFLRSSGKDKFKVCEYTYINGYSMLP